MAPRTRAYMNVDSLVNTGERYLWVRAVKAFVVILCGVVPAIVLGMMIVQSVRRGFDGTADSVKYGLIAGAVLLAPVALYAALIKTKLPIVVAGVGLVVIEGWSVWNAFTSESSTGGLAILWIPLAGIPFVLLGWAADVWIRAMWPVNPPS